MSLGSIISATLGFFLGLPKKKLVEIIDQLRKRYKVLAAENEQLKAEVERLKWAATKSKIKEVNKQSNKPSSKQAEWEQKGVGNDGKGKKRKRGKEGRKGAGNKSKDKPITKQEVAGVENCATCGKDLREVPPLPSSKTRIIEDIVETPLEVEVIEVLQEQKYCSDCQSVTRASTDLALPKADIGLNTTVHLIYLWISMCLPFTRIATYLATIFGHQISTAGLSTHVIRVAKIMQSVYEEILADIKQAKILHADSLPRTLSGKQVGESKGRIGGCGFLVRRNLPSIR